MSGLSKGQLVAGALVLATAAVLFPVAVVPLRQRPAGGAGGTAGEASASPAPPKSGIDRRSMWGEMRK